MEDSPRYTVDSYIPFGESVNDPQASGSRKNLKYDSETCQRSRRLRQPPDLNCPWKRTPVYTCGVVGLHEEVTEFYDLMSPTAEEAEIRLKAVEHITRTVHSLWPHAKVEIFGSFRTGLYLPSSDLDIVVNGEWKTLPLSTLSDALQKNGIRKDDITIIPHATVPIVRILHSPSRIRADISFNVMNGVKSAKFVKKLIKQYPPLPKLVLVLKQFLIHRGLNEVYSGGMSSYCLTLLVVSFLQGFHKPKTTPSTNLGTLLMEFFEHYGINFNYERVSIHFDNGGNYQPKYRNEGSYLTVEDPLVAGKDLAKGTFLMHQLKASFQNAFYTLHRAVVDSTNRQTPVNSYLEWILQVEEDVLNSRQWTSDNYSGILRCITRLLEKTSDSDSLKSTPKNDIQHEKKKRKSRNNVSSPDDR